jgi:hypothetical protein
MILATWILGAHVLKERDIEKNHIIFCALFFVTPWMLISMFFGLGAPPFGKPAEWVASATEQEVRYFFLIVAGVFYAFGFAILREKLKNTNGNLFSLLGVTAIQIAIPLFLIDMIFLGFFVDKLYSIMAASALEKSPQWALPMINQFLIIPIITCSLIYMATAAFAASLKSAGWFKPTACNIYIIISVLGFLLNILPPSVPEPLATLSFITTIPAVPFLMPYLMGVNFLKRAGN